MLTLNKVTWRLDDKAIATLLKVNDARRRNKLGADEMQISVTAACSPMDLAALPSYIRFSVVLDKSLKL